MPQGDQKTGENFLQTQEKPRNLHTGRSTSPLYRTERNPTGPAGLSALVRERRPIGLQGFGELIKGPSAAQMTALLTGEEKKPSGVALIMWSAATEDKVQKLKGEFQLNISWPYSSYAPDQHALRLQLQCAVAITAWNALPVYWYQRSSKPALYCRSQTIKIPFLTLATNLPIS